MQARDIAERLVEEIKPYAVRCEIGGSIRRGRDDVKDIEIIVIPNIEETTRICGLFSEPEPWTHNHLHTWATEGSGSGWVEWIKPGTDEIIPWTPRLDGKYWRGLINHNGERIKLDMFLCDAETWGYIFMLRTGSAQFNAALARRGLHHGVRYSVEDLRGCYEERDAFERLGIKWVEPESRFTGANVVEAGSVYEVIR